MYSYVGYSENMPLKLLVALYLFQAHMSVLLLSSEADSIKDSHKYTQCTTEMLFHLQTYTMGQVAHRNSRN
jgi:hypothetical protein